MCQSRWNQVHRLYHGVRRRLIGHEPLVCLVVAIASDCLLCLSDPVFTGVIDLISTVVRKMIYLAGMRHLAQCPHRRLEKIILATFLLLLALAVFYRDITFLPTATGCLCDVATVYFFRRHASPDKTCQRHISHSFRERPHPRVYPYVCRDAWLESTYARRLPQALATHIYDFIIGGTPPSSPPRLSLLPPLRSHSHSSGTCPSVESPPIAPSSVQSTRHWERIAFSHSQSNWDSLLSDPAWLETIYLRFVPARDLPLREPGTESLTDTNRHEMRLTRNSTIVARNHHSHPPPTGCDWSLVLDFAFDDMILGQWRNGEPAIGYTKHSLSAPYIECVERFLHRLAHLVAPSCVDTMPVFACCWSDARNRRMWALLARGQETSWLHSTARIGGTHRLPRNRKWTRNWLHVWFRTILTSSLPVAHLPFAQNGTWPSVSVVLRFEGFCFPRPGEADMRPYAILNLVSCIPRAGISVPVDSPAS